MYLHIERQTNTISEIAGIKHVYNLTINTGRTVAKPVTASFGSIRNNMLHICKDGILIQVTTGAEKNADTVVNGNDNLFADLIRKSLLIYIIRYGKSLEVKHVVFSEGDKEQIVFDNQEDTLPFVYCMAEGMLRLPFTETWRNQTFENIIASTSRSSLTPDLTLCIP